MKRGNATKDFMILLQQNPLFSNNASIYPFIQ